MKGYTMTSFKQVTQGKPAERMRLATLTRASNQLALPALFLIALTAPVLAQGPSTTPPTQLECGSMPSKILGRSVAYCVDVPANYQSSGARYPTLYFLHGLFENYHAWDENGGKDVFDRLLRQGTIGPFLVILPDAGTSFYVNSYDGRDRYEDFFIEELVPYIDRKYRTFSDPGARGISGVSMGGYGSLHLAMRHPNIFGSASAQSAALVSQFPNPVPTTGRWGFYAHILERSFGNPLNEAYWDANNPLTLAEHPDNFPNLKVYFDVGIHDRYGFEDGAELLDRILNGHEFPHTFALRPGNHGWEYERDYLKYSLFFHWEIFKAYEQVRTSGQ
jgi:S-formylglutathione hydrolase FrmB